MTHTNGQDSIIEKRSILRHLVCRETDLINNRITWLLTSQTILFLAFSNFYKEFELKKDRNRPKYNVYWFPWKRLPWLFGIAWFCFLLLASFDAINQWMGIEEHFFQLFCPSNIPVEL